MATIKLNVFGIELTWNGSDRGAASITSTMKEEDTIPNHAFNTGVDAIESMVLAHFCAGMDIAEPAYLEGIETAFLSLCNNIDQMPKSKSQSFGDMRRIEADQYFEFFASSMDVVDHNGWEESGDEYSKTVFIENPDGGDSLKSRFQVQFDKDSLLIRTSSLTS